MITIYYYVDLYLRCGVHYGSCNVMTMAKLCLAKSELVSHESMRSQSRSADLGWVDVRDDGAEEYKSGVKCFELEGEPVSESTVVPTV
jgi:hypothetical protein